MTKVYKIKRQSDGLFSTGGMNPKFSKTGKIWTTLGHLRSHWTLVREVKMFVENYKDCIVIEYNLDPQTTIDLSDL